MDNQSRSELANRDGLSRPRGLNRQVVGNNYEMGYDQDKSPPNLGRP
ncbi:MULTISPECIES: hypothetical protein [Paenibacillus]|nr:MULTISPECIES: hypothetical protein [Paenibacillus]QYK62725.1 hypothetical protein KAI37_03055 [Paenibacillus sp. S25]